MSHQKDPRLTTVVNLYGSVFTQRCSQASQAQSGDSDFSCFCEVEAEGSFMSVKLNTR